MAAARRAPPPAPAPQPTAAPLLQWRLQQRLRLQRLQVTAQQQGPLLLLPRVSRAQEVVQPKRRRMVCRVGAPMQRGGPWGRGRHGGRGRGPRPTCRARGRGATGFRRSLDVLWYVSGLGVAFEAVPPNAGAAMERRARPALRLPHKLRLHRRK